MATITWPWLRTRPLPQAQEDGLRRVALRLAAQTVALLLVMLLALGLVIYLITRQTIIGSLENTLVQRASQADPTICRQLHLSCGPAGFGPGPGGGPTGGASPSGGPSTGRPVYPGGPRPSDGSQNLRPIVIRTGNSPSDASAVYVNRQIHVIHGDGVLGAIVLDRAGMTRAVQTGQAQGFSVHSYEDQSFLVYSRPLVSGGKVVGAVQTSISEHQYEDTMSKLLQALLLVALLGLITSGGVSVVLTRRSLQPIRIALQRQRDFVADAAHELRTPLAIQRTVAEVGLGEAPDEDQQGTIEQMLVENQHLTRLVDDLSLLARADSHAVSIERRPLDLSSLISDTTSELTPLAEEQGVNLSVDVADGVGVMGDTVRLRQLLLILLDNALKHTPRGGEVDVRLHAQGGRAQLQVVDSGPGIHPEDLPHIFDRFYQANHARTGQGSGLGLAIGRWIAEAHGGHIQAENASPHGAALTVTLPLARPA